MDRLDEVICDLNYILETLRLYRDITKSGDCNVCSKKLNCEYVPEPGQLVRYNCPFFEKKVIRDCSHCSFANVGIVKSPCAACISTTRDGKHVLPNFEPRSNCPEWVKDTMK